MLAKKMDIPTRDVIRTTMEAAIARFLVDEKDLLKVRTAERSMCHKLAGILQTSFRDWNVDCE